MNSLSKYIIPSAVVVAAVIFTALPLRSQNANAVPPVVIEQYRILSARIPISGGFKSDEQLQRELNAVAAEGWKVRAATENAIIIAR